MGRKYRSAKGELVDFDLLKMKQSLAGKPSVPAVKAREDFVDGRLRRRPRKKIIPPLPTTLLENVGKKQPKTPVVEQPKPETKLEIKRTKQQARPKVEKKPEIIEPKEDNNDEEDKSDS